MISPVELEEYTHQEEGGEECKKPTRLNRIHMRKKTIDAFFFPRVAGALTKYPMMERRPVILTKVGCYLNGQDFGLVKPNYTEKKEKKKGKKKRKTLDATHKPERPML